MDDDGFSNYNKTNLVLVIPSDFFLSWPFAYELAVIFTLLSTRLINPSHIMLILGNTKIGEI